MSQEKSSGGNAPAQVHIHADKELALDDGGDPTKTGTSYDRNFRFISILGFTCVLMNTWEAVLIGASYGLINGGPSGMVWTYLGTVIGFCFVVLSMAEMSSMAPTSGGQYHWVSEFAPKGIQRFLSYIVGWVCVLAWHTGIASGGYVFANMLIGLLALNRETYVPQPFHGTLIVILVTVVCMLFNTFFAKELPLLECVVLILHVCAFFAVLIPLWVWSPRSPAAEVFGRLQDNGGWGSDGVVYLVGTIGPIYALIGPDAAVHMSEEIRDSSRILPLAMLWTLAINGITGFIMVITFAFCVGDVEDLLKTTTGFPFIQVFYNATGSKSATTALTCLIMVLSIGNTINNVATTSRQMYAFARDQALPFSAFLCRVNHRWTIPLNALCVSLVIVCLLGLINLGSSVAFNAVVSLGVAALLASYIVSIFCLRLKRWRGEPLPPARWSIGKIASSVETVAILFLTVVWVFTFFPLTREVTLETINWSSVIFSGVVMIALVYYFLHARKIYTGPVALVKPIQ